VKASKAYVITELVNVLHPFKATMSQVEGERDPTINSVCCCHRLRDIIGKDDIESAHLSSLEPA